MELNVQDWKEFKLDRLFTVELSKGDIKADDIEDGCIRLVSSGETDNGIVAHIDVNGDGIAEIFEGNVITVDMFCNAYYQNEPFYAVSHGRVNILIPKFKCNSLIAHFISTIINNEKYKYSYGRALYSNVANSMILKLPIKHNLDNTFFIDANKIFSDEGYVPDWQFMEDYIKSLHHKPITTSTYGQNIPTLDVEAWEEFYLKDLFECRMGNGIDAAATSNNDPKYNYVSRDSKGNGVVAQVDEYFNIYRDGTTRKEEPFQAGTMTLALGGSFLGSCFVQYAPYYTAQNVAVLSEKEPLSLPTKLFVSTLIRNECKYKYLAFGRELNTHYKTDFTIKLPIKRDENNNPIIDDKHIYSEKGFIPDWQFMEDYINSLPYSDRI